MALSAALISVTKVPELGTLVPTNDERPLEMDLACRQERQQQQERKGKEGSQGTTTASCKNMRGG